MDLDGFQREPGVASADLLHNPSKALVATWNKRVLEALNWLMSRQPLPSYITHYSQCPISFLNVLQRQNKNL